MADDKCGQIVWHDLFSADRQSSMTFYERVAGWSFAIEHAADFAWGGGERDFVLAAAAGEAGAGMIESRGNMPVGWIAYVEVSDVDVATERAERLGGEVVRPPFDVPGVGRNALVRDPLGALIGISTSQHEFPVPKRQFGVESYLADADVFPQRFYAGVFDWSLRAGDRPTSGGVSILTRSGKSVACHRSGLRQSDSDAMWVPSIKVADLASAKQAAIELVASQLKIANMIQPGACHTLIRDADGAVFRISANGQDGA
ncbi:glyoxalase [Tateyamaria omphalii]|uniref:VOC family protein n=1 Tax=Tateyamaria omphalii TaxID=299262 RepID=UPI0016752E25|nr:VOC family protein [Tateyamaria omphalii]GGX49613.1 glyoxalase [Tateyamaria omphalii]